MLKVDGHDDAILGVGKSFNRAEVLVYSVDKICQTLVERDGMSYDEAMEFYDFNIIGSYNGDGMPIFLRPYETY
jgi:hypothetical protein|tara:strand:+ start:7699 stop:7920 length:222 start_codon:yes stop_codon:yes gene_type:complete